jgi:hypothetical protein
MVYRLTGDTRYAERAWDELSAAAAFPDWHPAHVLATAEMTHAAGIGYDWLYGRLSAEQRHTVVEAIVAKGLLPAKKVYDGGGWWSKTTTGTIRWRTRWRSPRGPGCRSCSITCTTA